MKHLLSIGLLIAVTGKIYAQEQRFIEVSGQASRKVTPDEIHYVVSIDTEKLYDDYEFNYDFDQFDPVKSQEIQNKVALRVNSARQNLLSLLEELGLKEQTQASNPYDLTGLDEYAGESYSIKVSGFETLDKLVESLREYHLFLGFVVKMQHSEEDMIRETLQLEALEAARGKARKMARALDAKLGPVLQIRERPAVAPDPTAESYYTNADYYGSRQRAPSTTPTTIDLRVEVQVRFALE